MAASGGSTFPFELSDKTILAYVSGEWTSAGLGKSFYILLTKHSKSTRVLLQGYTPQLIFAWHHLIVSAKTTWPRYLFTCCDAR